MLLLSVVLFVTSVYAQAGIGSYNYWKKAEEQNESQLLGTAVTYRKVIAKEFSKRNPPPPPQTTSHQISLSLKKTCNNNTSDSGFHQAAIQPYCP